LTFLETVANPYTTVLGAPAYAATRINLAQSFNGIGWVFGPIAGAMFFYGTDETGRSTGSETLWIPYAAVGIVVLVLAVVFWRVPLPEVKASDDYHLDNGAGEVSAPAVRRGLPFVLLWLNLAVLSVSIGMICTAVATIFGQQWFRPVLLGSSLTLLAVLTAVFLARMRRITHDSIWLQSHFSGATLAQFFYVAAQAGIFAYFINYMTSQPPVPVTNATASTLASVGFLCFLAGRFLGAGLVKRFPAHVVLGAYGAAGIVLCLVISLRLGWVSMVAVFATYFFMSIMFPTIFALGIHGLGARSKRAASYIVMAIMGGAIVPKLMGHIADQTNVSFSFIVPMVCFAAVSLYGFNWVRLGGKPESAAP
jgi:MFS transporter, FHS family, L-fucose permease